MLRKNPLKLGYVSSAVPQRRRIARRLARWAVVGLIASALVGWAGVQGRELAAQYYMTHHRGPPGQVVYDDDPAAAAKLIGTGSFVEVCSTAPNHPGLCGAVRNDRPLGGLLGLNNIGVWFTHGMRTPSGASRVVIVGGLIFEPTSDGYWLELNAMSAPPATVVPGSRLRPMTYGGRMFVPQGMRLRIFAGQPDPQDRSHFTIGYELGGAAGTIDGRLRDDSYKGVYLSTRNGPAVIEMYP